MFGKSQMRQVRPSTALAFFSSERARPCAEPLERRQLLSAASVSYTLTDLGSLPGYRNFIATALNDAGQVVGYAGQANPYYSVDAAQGFVYRNGRMQAVGGRKSIATGINARGQIVGAFSAGGYLHPFVTSGGTATSVKDLYGPIAGPAHPGDFNSLPIPHSINDAGQIAGETIYGSGD